MDQITPTPSNETENTLASLDLIKEFNNLNDSNPKFSAIITLQGDKNSNKYIISSVSLERDYLFITAKTGKYFYCLKLEKDEPLTTSELSLSEKILKFMYFNNPKSEYKTGLSPEEYERLKKMQSNIIKRGKAEVTIAPDGKISVSEYREPSQEEMDEAIKNLDENGL